MDLVPLWQTWPTRGWPFSVAEEVEFRAALGPPGAFERDDLTLLVTILRCGTCWADAVELAPGLLRPPLAGAYDHLERLRSDATTALDRVLSHPAGASDEDLLAAEPVAAASVRRLTAAVAHGPAVTAIAVAELRLTLERVTSEAQRVEDLLSLAAPETCRQVGRLLVDPWNDGLWDHPFYLPRRVGDLSPRRVRDLLGERYPDNPLPL